MNKGVCGGPYLLIKTKWLNTRLSTLDCRHPPCPTHRPPPLREPPDSNSVRRQKTALVPWESLHWHYHFSFKDWFLHHHQRKAQLRDLVKCKVTEEAKWSRKRARVAGRAPLCVVAAVRRRSPGKQPARVKDIKDWRTPEPNWPSQGRPHPAKGGRINDCGFGIIHGKQKKKNSIFMEWIRTWPSYKNTSYENIKYNWTRNYLFWSNSVWITTENSIISLYSLLIILTKSQYKII